MVCNVIEECRCYAYKGETEQFCGVRKGPRVRPCPGDCCAGGCPENGSRQPFRFIDRPPKPSMLTPQTAQALILIAITVLIVLLYIDLKISGVRKI
jgi:hypothetical protein